MLHILLLILKIIGILLLIIIGLILFLFFSISFVPVRYVFYSEKVPDKWDTKVKFHWFLHIISFTGWMEEGTFQTKLKILGIRIKGREDIGESEEEIEAAINEEQQEQNIDIKVEIPSSFQKTESEREMDAAENIITQTSYTPKNKKHKISGMLKSGRQILKKIKYTWKHICAMLKEILSSVQAFRDFLNADSTRNMFDFVKKEGKVLFAHVKPKNITGRWEIGFDDPALTGCVLAVGSMFYPLIGEQIRLVPDFEHQIFQGNIKIEGRIQGIHFLLLLWRGYRNKDVMGFVNKIMNRR